MTRWLFALVAVLALSGEAFAAEFIAQRTMRAGSILAPGDLGAAGPTTAQELASVEGMEIRRAIFAGRPVSVEDIGPPTLVHRNDIVVMTYTFGALGLRTEGRSLGSGGVGERIEVMNLDTRMTIRATVVGQRRVEVRR